MKETSPKKPHVNWAPVPSTQEVGTGRLMSQRIEVWRVVLVVEHSPSVYEALGLVLVHCWLSFMLYSWGFVVLWRTLPPRSQIHHTRSLILSYKWLALAWLVLLPAFLTLNQPVYLCLWAFIFLFLL